MNSRLEQKIREIVCVLSSKFFYKTYHKDFFTWFKVKNFHFQAHSVQNSAQYHHYILLYIAVRASVLLFFCWEKKGHKVRRKKCLQGGGQFKAVYVLCWLLWSVLLGYLSLVMVIRASWGRFCTIVSLWEAGWLPYCATNCISHE